MNIIELIDKIVANVSPVSAALVGALTAFTVGVLRQKREDKITTSKIEIQNLKNAQGNLERQQDKLDREQDALYATIKAQWDEAKRQLDLERVKSSDLAIKIAAQARDIEHIRQASANRQRELNETLTRMRSEIDLKDRRIASQDHLISFLTAEATQLRTQLGLDPKNYQDIIKSELGDDTL